MKEHPADELPTYRSSPDLSPIQVRRSLLAEQRIQANRSEKLARQMIQGGRFRLVSQAADLRKFLRETQDTP